jgi:nucleoside-diphosphate-sugar epimerase
LASIERRRSVGGTVCVTGGLGFVGSRLCSALLDLGRPVRCVDSLVGCYASGAGPAAASALAARGAEVVRAHVGASADDPVLDGADAVIHLAALPGVRTPRAFAELWRENTRTTERLVRAAAERGARFVLASTSSVYGDAHRLPTPEDAAPSPLGPYARSKLAAERACLAAARERGADAVVVRLFTVYGPNQRPDMAFARWIHALAGGDPVPWHARSGAARDFTYVNDAVAGLLAALDRGRSGQAYNVSGGVPVPVRAALALIEHAMGLRATLERSPPAMGEARITAGCARKAAAELGYAPRTALAAGIARQVAAAAAVTPVRRPAGRARAPAARLRFGSESRAAARGSEWLPQAFPPDAALDPG